MKAKGYTLIEMMIVVAIMGILVSMFVGYSGERTTCIGGFVFAKGNLSKYGTSNVTQILDEQGHGIKCTVQ